MVRLSASEALSLYDLSLHELGQRAHQIKLERHGHKVTYIKTYYCNFTNICKYACKYCGFRRNKNDPDAYTLSIDAIQKKLTSAPENLTEVWFSNGLNGELPYGYYLDLLKATKESLPQVQIKAFTAVEIDFFARHYQKSHAQVLDDFMAAGLDRIPGGGAEIFDLGVRKKIDIKTRPEDYLKIHELCHQRGMPTSITMLFGHVETRAHRIKHMEIIRDFQDRSQGVQAFIPLAFQDENNFLGTKKGIRGPSPIEILKTLAISRIFLDNVDHIQSFWIDSGVETTQISLHCRIDDINGTVIEENIAHESGAKTPTYESSHNLIQWIRGADMIPVERDARYQEMEE